MHAMEWILSGEVVLHALSEGLYFVLGSVLSGGFGDVVWSLKHQLPPTPTLGNNPLGAPSKQLHPLLPPAYQGVMSMRAAAASAGASASPVCAAATAWQQPTASSQHNPCGEYRGGIWRVKPSCVCFVPSCSLFLHPR